MINNTIKELKQLPKDVQEKVAEMVGGGFGCDATVEYENGKYSVNSCSCLRKQYAKDFKVWFFNRKTVEEDERLKSIVATKDKEYEDWSKNEGKDFDWEAFGQ